MKLINGTNKVNESIKQVQAHPKHNNDVNDRNMSSIITNKRKNNTRSLDWRNKLHRHWVDSPFKGDYDEKHNICNALEFETSMRQGKKEILMEIWDAFGPEVMKNFRTME